jgi:integrase
MSTHEPSPSIAPRAPLSLTPPAAAATPTADDLARTAAAFFARYEGTTLTTYAQKLRAFAAWLGVDFERLPAELLARGPVRVTADVEAFRAHLRATLRPRPGEGRGRADRPAPATVNGYLAAIRSLVRFLQRAHVLTWSLYVDAEPAEAYRDTRGPGLDAVARLLVAADTAAARAREPRLATRDRAILRLLTDLALRRAEALALDVADVERDRDGTARAVWVRGKGRKESERLTLPPKTAAAVAAWLAARLTLDEAPAGRRDTRPLFVSLDPGAGREGRRHRGSVGPSARVVAGRLTARALGARFETLGRLAGIGRVSPHGLRHTAITAVLDAGASTRDAQRFSRHKDPRTLLRYDDNRADLRGRLAADLSERY